MSSALRIVKPLIIGDAQLISSTAPENDCPVWNPQTAYAVGDRVIRPETHRIYQRSVAGTTALAPEADTANWVDVGATNRWKMFDNKVSSQTVANNSLTVVLSPGAVFNCVALLNVVATSIRIRVIDANDGVVYDKTSAMTSKLSRASYWAFFFEEPSLKTKLVAADLPTYGRSANVEITLTYASGAVACGVCVVGVQRQIGDKGIRYGAQIGITDYSHKGTNEYGETQLVERAWSDRSSFSIEVPNRQIDVIKTIFASLRTTPVLWIASDIYESLVLYGTYKDFSAVIAYPNYSDMNLEIEGLI